MEIKGSAHMTTFELSRLSHDKTKTKCKQQNQNGRLGENGRKNGRELTKGKENLLWAVAEARSELSVND